MKTELTRFRIKPGKSEVVDEWMKFLNDNMSEVLLTLKDEKMYVESIFREKAEDAEYLYWFSVQGENGADVNDSESWIDKKHLDYFWECIDTSIQPFDLDTEVVMIPENISAMMKD